MRLYVIDQMTEDNVRRVESYLRDKKMGSAIEGLFWRQVPDALLTQAQSEHMESCGPYAFGIELHSDALKMELLARAQNRLHCDCIAYADAAQRSYALDWLDSLLRELDIPV